MAKNVSDLLNESFFGDSADVEDFRPSLIATCVFNSFLSYTTIILNIGTIHAIRKTALLPKPLRTLLLSLAASDVGVGLLAQPLFISILVVSWLKRSRIDPISFKGLMAVMYFFCASSLFNVVAISVDRFLAVHLHLRYQELVTHKCVITAVISIWLFSAITSSSVFWDPFLMEIILWLVIMTVCLIVVVTVYWRIYIILKRHKNQIQSLQIQEVQQGVQNGDLSNILKLRKSAHGTFYVCIVFLICFLPFYIFSFLFLSRSLNPISLYKAWLYATTLFFLNSSLNPVVYCWKMGPIRRTLMDIMRSIVNRFRE